jgi:endonuclease/exonuclease/phosphatase family metal-dependent hydrolase
MKKTLLSLLFLLLLYATTASSQSRDTLHIMEWNVENLFDCRHDTLKNDTEFLPDGIRHWSTYRYYQKLDKIAKTIVAASASWNPPALVALCEVENDSALIALTEHSPLRELGYRYVMTNSPDLRGINVALLYQRDQFKLTDYRSIRLDSLKGFRPTRDILYIEGMLANRQILNVFIVHAPSRSGGAVASEPYRTLCAQTLMKEVALIQRKRKNAHIIITGDFNDYPESPSISKIINAKAPSEPVDKEKLYHLLARKVKTDKNGTYKYQGEWNLLDHFIVSGTLLDENSQLYTNEKMAKIANLPFLLTEDKNYGGLRPLRTYYGMKYENGYSDHLPILMQLVVVAE